MKKELVERIKQRRREIEEDAPCQGCGSSLRSCKAQRGKDPTAPPWFGCCAIGADFRPCQHRVSGPALLELIKQIEQGEVISQEDQLLASLTEYPGRRGRVDVGFFWPDDVEMPGHGHF